MRAHCPQCRKVIPTVAEDSAWPPYFPFCSKRCKLVDLNAWLESDYRIVSSPSAEETEDLPSDLE